MKKYTSPSNEFLLNACRSRANQTGQTDERTDTRTDMQLHHLDKRYSPIISAICGPNEKMLKFKKKSIQKKYTIPANEFLLIL